MDDAIVLSDGEEDECILIEETTVNTEQRSEEQVCSTSFSLVDAVNKKPPTRPRSDAISPKKDWLEKGMDELEELMRKNRENNQKTILFGTDDDDLRDINMDFLKNRPSTSSTLTTVTQHKPEKRKLTDDEKELQKELRENAKRVKEAEKEKKAIEKDQRKGEMMKKREEKEKEKETRKIEREMSAAINSKCELYTYCHIGKTVLDTLPGLEAELRVLYLERKIENQMKIDKDLGTRIEWRRKCIEMKEDETGRNERFEYMSTQNLFAVVVSSSTLKDVILSNSLRDFIVEQRTHFQNGRCTMLIVSYGRLDIHKKRLHSLSLEIYEKHRAQIVQVDSIPELALFTAQYLRSLARREKKRMTMTDEESGGGGGGGGGGSHKLQYQGEKGIVIGSRLEIVSDWWSKMLATIDRLSDAQRRAILKLIPDPIAGIDKYSKMDYSLAIKEISELVAENGRRVGPAIAHRVLTMLTDETGNAIVE